MCFALLPLLTLLPQVAAPLPNPLQAMPLTYYFLLYHDLLLLILSYLILCDVNVNTFCLCYKASSHFPILFSCILKC